MFCIQLPVAQILRAVHNRSDTNERPSRSRPCELLLAVANFLSIFLAGSLVGKVSLKRMSKTSLDGLKHVN